MSVITTTNPKVRAVEDAVVTFLGALVGILFSSGFNWAEVTHLSGWLKLGTAAGAVALPAARSALALLLTSGNSSGIVEALTQVRKAVAAVSGVVPPPSAILGTPVVKPKPSPGPFLPQAADVVINDISDLVDSSAAVTQPQLQATVTTSTAAPATTVTLIPPAVVTDTVSPPVAVSP